MTDILYQRTFGILLLLIFLQYGPTRAQDPSCDYYQNVEQGVTYYIYSKGYPSNYVPLSTCRWQASCPANTRCNIDCTLEIPESQSCRGDRLLVSKSGDSSLTGSEKYCGTGTINIFSTSNGLSLALITASDSPGGRFLCMLTAQSTDPDPVNCQCGWKKMTRIVGGTETLVNEYPMMVGLIDFNLMLVYCGGTIISPYWVITAAHCLQSQQISNLGVLYGDHNIRIGTETDSATLIRAGSVTIHPSYNNIDDDIGLIKTAQEMIYSEKVGPACLPFKYSATSFADFDVQALGWGTTAFAGADSDYLQKVDLNVMNQAECTSIHGGTITPKILCTYNVGKDACQHDSGGPLLWQDPGSGKVYLVGIIIAGYGCATSKPGVNTRITQYLEWIAQNAEGADLCRIN